MNRNRKEQREIKLVGVNRAVDPTKLKLGTFQSLTNLIPAKRYKIKKKRGVVLLVNEADVLNPATCALCPQGTLPEAQDLDTVCCYDNVTDIWSDVTSSSGQINYVNPADHSFWCTSGEANGFASGPYPDDASILWKLWEPTTPAGPGCTLTDIGSTEAVEFTGYTANVQSTQAAQAGRSGHSDEKSYMLAMSGITPALWDAGTNSPVYFGETSGAVVMRLDFPCDQLGPWTKYGSDIFSVVKCVGSNGLIIAHWPIPFADNYEDYLENFVTGGVTDPGSPIPGITSLDAFKSLHANATALYALCDGAEFANPTVFSMDKGDFSLIDSWAITNADFATPLGFHVYSDDLIFVLGYVSEVIGVYTLNIGFLDTATGITTTLGTVVSDCIQDGTSDGAHGFQYANNYFYIGFDGGKVLKVGPLLCPGTSNLWEVI